jgi:hypothetical protein
MQAEKAELRLDRVRDDSAGKQLRCVLQAGQPRGDPTAGAGLCRRDAKATLPEQAGDRGGQIFRVLMLRGEHVDGVSVRPAQAAAARTRIFRHVHEYLHISGRRFSWSP